MNDHLHNDTFVKFSLVMKYTTLVSARPVPLPAPAAIAFCYVI